MSSDDLPRFASIERRRVLSEGEMFDEEGEGLPFRIVLGDRAGVGLVVRGIGGGAGLLRLSWLVLPDPDLPK